MTGQWPAMLRSAALPLVRLHRAPWRRRHIWMRRKGGSAEKRRAHLVGLVCSRLPRQPVGVWHRLRDAVPLHQGGEARRPHTARGHPQGGGEFIVNVWAQQVETGSFKQFIKEHLKVDKPARLPFTVRLGGSCQGSGCWPWAGANTVNEGRLPRWLK